MDSNTFSPIDGSSYRFAIVRARFNEEITQGLLDSAVEVLLGSGVAEHNIRTLNVPGSFEVIHAANQLAAKGNVDAIICIGAIIKGDTKHDEYLAQSVYSAMKDITLAHNVPVVAMILTVNTKEQAEARSGKGAMNRGAEAAHVALEMAALRTHLE